MARDPDKNGLLWLVVALALGGAAFGGYKWYQNRQQKKVARVSTCSLMTSMESIRQTECALFFPTEPPAGFEGRLSLRVTGKSLAEEHHFGWPEIAFRHVRVKPGQAPPVGKELRFVLPIRLLSELESTISDHIVTVRVLWDGNEIDNAIFSTQSVYKRK